MAAVPSIIPISELRQDTAGVIKRTRVSEEPVFITQRGRATAVLVSTQAYEKIQYELGLLRALARGEMEAAGGEGEDLDAVFSQIEARLSEAR